MYNYINKYSASLGDCTNVIRVKWYIFLKTVLKNYDVDEAETFTFILI